MPLCVPYNGTDINVRSQVLYYVHIKKKPCKLRRAPILNTDFSGKIWMIIRKK